jgi:hypothetical protein
MLKSFAWNPHWAESQMGKFFEFQNKLFFRSGEAEAKAMWISDGTIEGTVKFHEASIVTGYDDPPANPTMQPLLLDPDQVQVQGVVVGVMRKY